MVITVSIQLDKDDNLAYTPDGAATQVLAALGGNPQNDHCIVYVMAANEPGTAGTPPDTPVP